MSPSTPNAPVAPRWRLLPPLTADGATQMAIDEALLEGLRLGLSPPTLRFYRFAPATLSLGYAQKLEGLDAAACAAAGVAWVRRPTGGRAVLHAGEFTYAITASGLPSGVSASYRHLATALSASLARLGVAGQLEAGAAGAPRSPDCFAAATQADLVALGGKLIGSAQMRRQDAVLQHGSLYLRYPLELARAVLGPARAPQVPDLASALGAAPSWEMVADAFTAGFAEALGGVWEAGTLSEWEQARVGEMRATFVLAAAASPDVP